MQIWKQKFAWMMIMIKPQDQWILTDDLNAEQLQSGWHRQVQKHLFARFKCSSCSKVWKSIQVVVVFHIRRYRRVWSASQGVVNMRVFRQKCNICKKDSYADPIFSEEAIHKVLHGLVVKILEKCYGKSSRAFDSYQPVAEEDVDGPHDRDNCEACEQGMCVSPPVSLVLATERERKKNILVILLSFLASSFFWLLYAFAVKRN
ncbi:UNVERIFIED_CONTAM: hypothetical protein K2H54_064545 [Gekko kuhli]